MPDDFSSDISTTGAVTLGGSRTGTLETAGDTDWISVSLAEGLAYRFRVQADGVPSNAGIDLTLFSYSDFRGQPFELTRSGYFLGSIVEYSSEGRQASFRYSPFSDEVAYIQVSGTDGYTGDYTVFAEAIPDDYSADATTSGRVVIGGEATGEITGDETDWFALAAEAGVTYELAIIGDADSETPPLTSPIGLVVDALDSNLAQLTTDFAAGEARGTFTAPSTGTFYVSVIPSAGGLGTYTLTAEATGEAPPGNAGDEYYQYDPLITGLANGGFVVTWGEFIYTGLGPDNESTAKAKVFAADGEPVTDEFVINTQSGNYIRITPSITGLEDGGFVVSWTDFRTVEDYIDSSSPEGSSVMARIYDSNGVPVSDDFVVGLESFGFDPDSAIARLPNGNFVVTWESYTGVNRYSVSIKAKVFSADGTPMSDTFPVNYAARLYTINPDVVGLANGNIVVSWTDLGFENNVDGASLKARIFSAEGVPVVGEFTLNAGSLGVYSGSTEITGLANGNFVVTWHDHSTETLGDTEGQSIKAKIFNANGVAVTNVFRINTETENNQADPTITSLANGGFAVSWRDTSQTLGDSDGSSIKAKVFDAMGLLVKDEFLVNSDTIGNQSSPTITGLSNGDFAVSWIDEPNIGSENTSIRTRVFSADTSGTEREGGEGPDDLVGTPGDDTLNGFAGEDMLDGKGGRDVLNGGDGEDTVVFNAEVRHAINLKLDGPQNTGEGLDTLINIENLVSGDREDRLFGDTGANRLTARGGDDTVFGDGAVAAYYGSTIANQVFRLYQATLGRVPDIEGHTNWSERIASGARNLLEVAEGFVRSPEFKATYSADITNTEFVTLLYDNVLDRAPDAGGLGRWVDALESGDSRAQVVLGFAGSPEFNTNTAAAANTYARGSIASGWSDEVYRLYQSTLDRTPDVTGMINWSARLATGEQSLLDVADGFVRSPQFQATYQNLDNTAFVTLLYKNVLDRAPDDQGLARWTGELANGASRAEVVLGFSQSPQFAANTAADVKGWMRNLGTHDWIDAGNGTNLVAGGQFADVFVFNETQDGRTTLADLEAWDFIELDGFGFGTVADARAEMSQVGNTVVFADQGVEVTFRGTALADVTDDMILV